MTTVIRQMQQRAGTSSQWSTANTVLLAGEHGFDTTLKKFKIGDGVTAWNSLPFATYTPAEVDALLADYATTADVQAAINEIFDDENVWTAKQTISHGDLANPIELNNTSVDSDAVDFLWSFGKFSLTSSDSVSYTNHVYCMGLNVSQSRVAKDPTKPYMALQFESRFTNSTDLAKGSEFHLEFMEPNISSPADARRVLSYFLPFDKNVRTTQSLSLSADRISVTDQLGVQKMQFNLESATGQVSYTSAFNHQWNANNFVPFVVKNSAGNAFLNMPWIDNRDRLRIQQHIRAIGQYKNTDNENCAFLFVGGSIPNYGASLRVELTPSSSVAYAVQAIGVSSGRIENQVYNQGNGQHTAAYFSALINGSTGHCATQYYATGKEGFDVGYEATSDEFRISSWNLLNHSPGTYIRITHSSTTPANATTTVETSLRINQKVGFNNTAPIAKPTVTGSRGSNAALASLLTALASYGLITDSTS